jgi:hypothetical protein
MNKDCQAHYKKLFSLIDLNALENITYFIM